jgi:hypothetical protein
VLPCDHELLQKGVPSLGVPLHELIPLAAVPAHAPRRPNGKPVSLATVYLWVRAGLKIVYIRGKAHTHPS